MELNAPETTEIVDHDLVDEEPDTTVPKASARPGRFQFEVPVQKTMRAPADAGDPGADAVERTEEDNAAFLEAVQRNLVKFGLKPGGKVTDFRALKYWDVALHGAHDEITSNAKRSDDRWKNIMESHKAFFDQTDADDNDFIVLVEYPSGETAAIPIRRVSPDSLPR